jgi:GNAT superfamily N-acetyltransferase
MTQPDVWRLYATCEATWPPARQWTDAGITFRDGAGGGKRVSAATTSQVPDATALSAAEDTMRGMGQPALFMIREGETALDQALDQAGYTIVDPVNIYLTPIDRLTDQPIPPVTAFTIWEPLAIMREVWADGGIDQGRIDVMNRAEIKTACFARLRDKPAGVAFAGLHDDIAMVHAVHVLAAQRRLGAANWLMRAAAHWAKAQGARWISVLCTQANSGANALYQDLGFDDVGRYHYRIKEAT